MRIVVKLGGHLLAFDGETRRIAEYATALRRMRRNGLGVVVVVGGGETARRYLDGARRLGADESFCDQIGIEVARLNARLLIAGLGDDAYKEPPESLGELWRAMETGKIVVMGGLTPGHSTDAVAAIAAEAFKADLLIRATDVDGIYTADPKVDPKARKLPSVSYAELAKMSLEGAYWAGSYELIDPVAVKILERSKIPTRFIDGRDADSIEAAAEGLAVGTIVAGGG